MQTTSSRLNRSDALCAETQSLCVDSLTRRSPCGESRYSKSIEGARPHHRRHQTVTKPNANSELVLDPPPPIKAMLTFLNHDASTEETTTPQTEMTLSDLIGFGDVMKQLNDLSLYSKEVQD